MTWVLSGHLQGDWDGGGRRVPFQQFLLAVTPHHGPGDPNPSAHGAPGCLPFWDWAADSTAEPCLYLAGEGSQEARGLSSLPAFLEAMIIGERASHWSRGLTSSLPPSPRPERLADPQVLVATSVTLFLVPKGGAQSPAWCSAAARNSDSEESPSQGGRRDLAE